MPENKYEKPTVNNFPCFVDGGAAIEDPDKKNENGEGLSEKEKYAITARNGLRHLTYGTPLKESKIANWRNFSALFLKKDPELLSALREELQHVFDNISTCLAKYKGKLDAKTDERFQVFINNLIAAYPFLDPNESKSDQEKDKVKIPQALKSDQNSHQEKKKDEGIVEIPQKINNEWVKIQYKFKKIDISPQKGFLSKLIEDQDRLYAYCLEPIPDQDAKNTNSLITIMGSTYPSAQGAELNWLYNFTPQGSIGEGHDMTRLGEWINAQPNKVNTYGHSKGATLAMILAAQYPNKIEQAHCLNPTTLINETLNHLNKSWDAIPDDKKPKINVYSQSGDPVFLLGNGLLKGSIVYNIKDKDHPNTHWFALHAHYMAGRKNVSIDVSNNVSIVNTFWRELVTKNKLALNMVMFPIMYLKLCSKIIVRKISRYCDDNIKFFGSLLFIFAALVCSTYTGMGALLPLLMCAGAGLAAAYITYKVLDPGTKLTSDMAFSTVMALAFVMTIAIVAGLYLIKTGINSALVGVGLKSVADAKNENIIKNEGDANIEEQKQRRVSLSQKEIARRLGSITHAEDVKVSNDVPSTSEKEQPQSINQLVDQLDQLEETKIQSPRP